MPDPDDDTRPGLGETIRRVFDELKAYYDELEGQSSRAAAVLAVASLENELEVLIRSKFPRDISNTKWKRIAGPGPTPFGTLRAKTDVAEAFGFFGPKTRKTIDLVARVRNKFAHHPKIHDFDHSDVLELCRDLASNPVHPYTLIDNPEAADIRGHYITTVKTLTVRLEEIRRYIPELDDSAPQPLP